MGGAIIRRFALFPLMLLMLLLLPGRMVAETDYDTSVTLKELAGNPEGNTNETYANLFDGKKTKDKFCSDANATQEVCYASLSAQPYVVFEEGTGTLTFRYDTYKPEGAYDLNVGKNKPKWSSLFDKIKKVVFDASFANARPKSCYWWFGECLNLTRIEGMENLNTEMVTTMAGMFYQCEALTSLDVTNFNTAKVTDMSLMFSSCTKLSSLNLYNFNTENVTNMLAMFSSCKNLATIYTSEKFVTTKVDNLNHFMFDDDEQLKGANAYDEMKTRVHCANYKTGYFTKLVGKNGDEKIGATGETLATDNLVLDDAKDFVAYEPFAAKAASYSRKMNAGTTWATLCLPFEVSLENQNFRAFKLLSADDVTETVELEEIEGSIAAGTPVIIKMKDGATKLNFTVADKEIAKDVQTAETANGNY